MDLIDRQATIDALEKVAEIFPWRIPGNRDSYDHYNEAWNDAIGRAEIEIEKLPSAQPERPKGEWIPQDHNKSNGCATTLVYYFPKCSECGHSGDSAFAFCPWCGADMRGEQNETD